MTPDASSSGLPAWRGMPFRSLLSYERVGKSHSASRFEENEALAIPPLAPVASFFFSPLLSFTHLFFRSSPALEGFFFWPPSCRADRVRLRVSCDVRARNAVQSTLQGARKRGRGRMVVYVCARVCACSRMREEEGWTSEGARPRLRGREGV